MSSNLTVATQNQITRCAGASYPPTPTTSSSFPAVSRIPLEILSEIFKHTIASEATDMEKFKATIHLSGVSKYWRAGIVNNPVFWCIFWRFESCEIVDTFMKRSKRSMIRIKADSRNNTVIGEDVAEKLFSALDRTTYLAFNFCVQDFECLEKLLTAPTSSIEVFRVTMKTRARPDIAVDPPIFPDTIFGGGVQPKLQLLHLDFCAVEWTSRLLCNTLTMLHLDSQNRPTYEEFIDAFKNMPLLAILYLKYSCPTLEEKAYYEYPADAVTLPNLHQLHVSDDLDSGILFLHTVKCSPEYLSVGVDSIDEHSPDLNQDLVDYVLIRLGRALNGFPFSHVDVSTSQVFHAGLISFTCYISDSHVSDLYNYRILTLQIGVTNTVNIIQDVLETFFTTLPLIDVESARCEFEQVFSDGFWLDTIAPNLVGVEDLQLSTPALQGFLEAYYHRYAAPSATPLSPISFFRLEQIFANWDAPEIVPEILHGVLDKRALQRVPINLIPHFVPKSKA